MCRGSRRLLALLVALALLPPLALAQSAPPPTPDPQQVARGRELSQQARALAQKGETAKAEALLRQLIAAKTQSFGAESEELLPDLGLLSELDIQRGAYSHALTLLNAAVKILTQAKREESGDMGLALSRLGFLYMVEGKRLPAELTLLKAIALNTRNLGADSPAIAADKLRLATLYTRSFQLEKARKLIDEVGAATPPDGSIAAQVLEADGEWYLRQGRHAEAEAAQRRAAELDERLYGADHPNLAKALGELGYTLIGLNRLEEAEAMMRRAIAIYEARQGLDSPAVGALVQNLGKLYLIQGRYAGAEQALLRSSRIAAATSGADSFLAATAQGQLGQLYLLTGALPEAEAALRRALAVWERPLTANPTAAALIRVALATVKRQRGDAAAGQALIDPALVTLETAYGKDNIVVGDALIERASIVAAQGDTDGSIHDLERAVAIWETAAGGEHPGTVKARAAYAEILARAGRLDEALAQARLATDVLRARIRHINAGRAGSPAEEVRAMRRGLGIHVEIATRLAELGGGEAAAAYTEEAFVVAQSARATEASRALANMASRFAAGDDARAALVRKLQDATEAAAVLERNLAGALGSAAVDRDLKREAAWRQDLARLAGEVEALQGRIEREYPDYAQLTAEPTVSSAALRRALRPGETMLVYLVAEGDTFGWAITADGMRLFRAGIGRRDLNRSVRQLRRALDPRRVESMSDLKPLDFDLAHSLYTHLVEPAGLADNGGLLIVVPDGSLQSLPFGVLLADERPTPFDFDDYRSAHWLAAAHPLGVLPSAASLVALRQLARAPAAGKRYLGIGNPVLSGDESLAKSGDTADLVRSLIPLPETATELQDVAKRLGAGADSVVLADRATESYVKTAPLADYRILHFATHGLMAGDFSGLREPALVLTPPAKAKGDDDGLLTASEISGLKIDADWVILSACNTAAPDGTPGAEGFSGLAKAFFFAGSRALLVSHWEVLSEAAVELSTRMIEAVASDPTVSRGEAQRRAVLALINDRSHDYLAHPLFWAPFVLVGEAGAVTPPS